MGEIDELRAAALRLIDTWDNGTGSVLEAIDALRAVLEPKPVEVEKETRYSWTEDYYDDKGGEMTLKEAAEQVLECCGDVVNGWDSLAPLLVRRAAAESLDALRAVLEPKPVEVEKETRFSWTEDYYDYDKGDK